MANTLGNKEGHTSEPGPAKTRRKQKTYKKKRRKKRNEPLSYATKRGAEHFSERVVAFYILQPSALRRAAAPRKKRRGRFTADRKTPNGGGDTTAPGARRPPGASVLAAERSEGEHDTEFRANTISGQHGNSIDSRAGD